MVEIRDKELHKKIFKRINYYEDKAIEAYEKNDMKKGFKYEKLSDNVYVKNYKKMFRK